MRRLIILHIEDNREDTLLLVRACETVRLPADFFQEVQTAHFGQHEVENDDVRMKGVDEVEAGFTVKRGLRLEMFDGELVAVNIGDELVVLDDEYFLHAQLLASWWGCEWESR